MEEPIHEIFIVSGSTIRHGDWKLFVKDQQPGGGTEKGDTNRVAAKKGSLFNLGEDPGETRDLSADYPEKAASLEGMMKSYMEIFNQNIRPREYVNIEK